MADSAANAVISLPTPTLRTARLLLRPFTDADTDAIFGAADSSAWPFGLTTLEGARGGGALYRALPADGAGRQRRTAGHSTPSDGIFIGWRQFDEFGTQHIAAQWWVTASLRRPGAKALLTEAAGALLQWAFNTLNLNVAQSEADTRNAASDRAAGKARFFARRHVARKLYC